jgi:hypothetical protein
MNKNNNGELVAFLLMGIIILAAILIYGGYNL